MSIQISSIVVGKWNENTYLLHNNKEGWLIDPGDEFEKIKNSIIPKELKLKGIINTHGHFDHLGAVEEFRNQYDVKFYIHSKDRRLVGQANLYRKFANGEGVMKTPVIDFFLDDLKGFQLGDQFISFIHTPGHTNGSVSFIIERNIIIGDLFFSNSIGRTDLPGGNKTLTAESTKFVLNNYKGYKVYPGHGESFMLTEEYSQKILKLIDGN